MVEEKEVGRCAGSKGERMRGTVGYNENDMRKHLVRIKK
jgi:hypothetical protein